MFRHVFKIWNNDQPNRALMRFVGIFPPVLLVAFFVTFFAAFLDVDDFGGSSAAYGQTTTQTLTTKQSNQLELDQLNEQLEQAAQRQASLRDEIASLDKDIGAINRALIASARRGQELETQITQSEVNLSAVTKAQSQIQQSLSKKRGLLAEVLGALQRMGRKPPPALLIKPQDALASVRSAILLGAVVPQIRQQTNILVVEMQTLVATTNSVNREKETMANQLNALAEDETRLTLLMEEKNELTQRSREDLLTERNKAHELAGNATSLKELIGTLEGQIASAAAAAKAAEQADARREKEEAQRLARAKQFIKEGKQLKPIGSQQADPTRNSPAVAFSKAKGKVIWPVSGEVLYGFGSKTSNPRSRNADGKSRNIAMATRANARVSAPADGWVVYSGPFRSFGQLLILNLGEDHHLLLAGMKQINVDTGRFVLAGEPIGRMGARSTGEFSVSNSGANRPILYVELRKSGQSIDASTWWGPRVRSSAALNGD